LPAPVLILAGAPLAASIWLVWRSWDRPVEARTIVAGLFAAGFGLILITEFFYIQDVFQGRYNTLFKVYYQVWTLLGVGAAVAVGLLWREVAAASRREIWRPVLAGGTALAIRWLADHAQEDDIVLEAPGCQYQINYGVPTSRISAFTGVPTLIGQDGAEGQWRDQQPELQGQIGVRADEIAEMYDDPRSDLFARYGITLLYVGEFERNGSGPDCEKGGPYPSVEGADYPGAGWTEVFSSDDGALYRRSPAS
jgi:uncharacterized membrane protein